jgi:hypothetical protein
MRSSETTKFTGSRIRDLLRTNIAKQRFHRFRKIWQLGLGEIYSVADKRFDRLRESFGGLTTDVRRIRQLIDDRSIDQGALGRFAPHHFTIKINYAIFVRTSPKAIRTLEDEILAQAIDHINDNRYQTFRPVEVQLSPEVFTSGIIVEPTFGEDQKLIRRKTAHAKYASAMRKIIANSEPHLSEIALVARFSLRGNRQEEQLVIMPGSSHLNVGRAPENDLFLDHPTVSFVHGAIAADKDGRFYVADTGSMSGTFINGRRIPVGTASRVTDRDSLSFGDVKVRLRLLSTVVPNQTADSRSQAKSHPSDTRLRHVFSRNDRR